jgi:NADP-reducing hydrogenase subunit HndB
MPAIKSLEELKRIKEEALKKREATQTSGRVQITVPMGTCGIAAGARETMKAILDFIETENLGDVVVRQTGNSGLDEWEPIIKVSVGGQPEVTYGKVTPEKAQRIMKEHVMQEKIVDDFVIPA